jgi:hypothetical protein
MVHYSTIFLQSLTWIIIRNWEKIGLQIWLSGCMNITLHGTVLSGGSDCQRSCPHRRWPAAVIRAVVTTIGAWMEWIALGVLEISPPWITPVTKQVRPPYQVATAAADDFAGEPPSLGLAQRFRALYHIADSHAKVVRWSPVRLPR